SVFSGLRETAGDTAQPKLLKLAVPAGQLAGGAGAAENVDIQRLHEVGVDVTLVLGRGQEQVFQLLLGAAVLQKADPVCPAAGIGLPAEKAKVKRIDDMTERFGRPEDAIRHRGLTLRVQD